MLYLHANTLLNASGVYRCCWTPCMWTIFLFCEMLL